MSNRINRQILLAARPVGWPRESDFQLEETALPQPSAGQFLVRNIYMSVDPYMRARMNDRKSYVPPFQVGKPLEGGAIGQVIKSNHPAFPEGSLVSHFLGWREYFVSAGEGMMARIDPAPAPISTYLGILGIPGFTGWYGLKEIGRPKAGETLAVSAAAGATGSLVAQMGKILGCRVVGTAGSDAKCAYLTGELGLDAAINYKTAGDGDVYAALREACPKGIDIYFENVGGPILDAVLRLLNPFSRIPLCGMISQYNLEAPEPGPRFLVTMIPNRTLMQAFIITDHLNRHPEFIREVGGWLKAGKLKYKETVVEGLENAPKAFLGLMRGENMGKRLIRLAPDPS